MIEIALSVHDWYGYYYQYLGLSLLSVMENTKSAVRFHILCDKTLTENARKDLTSLCTTYKQQISFYDIALDKRIPVDKLLRAGYCEGILYRLYLPELLPDIQKIIYLDADILVHMDIQELWNEDIGDAACAGRWDPPLFGYKELDKTEYERCLPFWEHTDWNCYINSGVLVLNLERIRHEHNLLEESISFWNTYGWAFPDQDALNYILRGKTCIIDSRYNTYASDYPPATEPCFYHYTYMAGERNILNALDKLYLSYWQKSPFYKAEYGKKEKVNFLRQIKNRTESYERLAQLCQLSGRELLLYAQNLCDKGNYKKVLEVLSTSASTEAADFRKKRALIIYSALQKMGRPEDALTVLEAELSEPQKISYYHQHQLLDMHLLDAAGDLYKELKQYEKAEIAYRNALYFGTPQKNNCAHSVLMHLTSCMLHAGNIQKAQYYYNMLYGMAPMDTAVQLLGFQVQFAALKQNKKPSLQVKAQVTGGAETIEIAYSIHDYFGNYWQYMAISMFSVMQNTKRNVRFHILCDDTLPYKVREELLSMCEQFGQLVLFYDMQLDKRISLLNLLKSGYCEGALYRLSLPELLPDVPKILYLDTDILANCDIQELWNMDVSDYAAAGRWDPPLSGCKQTGLVMPEKCQHFYAQIDWKNFVNSGVLLLNLERIRREHNFIEESLSFWENYGWSIPDQDAINYILRGKIRFIPAQYNMYTKDLKKAKQGIIYHFTDLAATDGRLNEVERLYLSYWEKSPFYNKDWRITEKLFFLRQMKNRSETGLRLLQMNELSSEGLIQLAENLIIMQDYQKAYDVLSGSNFEGDIVICRRRAYLMAEALERLGLIEKALETLRPTLVDDKDLKYISHDVKNMEQWNYYGLLCARLGRYKEAEEAFLHGLYFGTPGKNICGTTSLYLLVDCARCMGNAKKERIYTIMLKTLCQYDMNTVKDGEKKE